MRRRDVSLIRRLELGWGLALLFAFWLFAVGVFVRFAATGEVLASRRGSVVYHEEPALAGFYLFLWTIPVVTGPMALWLHFSNRKNEQRFYRSLVQRTAMDNGRRQDVQGRNIP